MVVCCNDEVDLFDPTSDVIGPGGPILLGIGLIPKTQIIGGIANTSTPYPVVVTDAVFGGSIAVLVNHVLANALGAVYYTVKVDGVFQLLFGSLKSFSEPIQRKKPSKDLIAGHESSQRTDLL